MHWTADTTIPGKTLYYVLQPWKIGSAITGCKMIQKENGTACNAPPRQPPSMCLSQTFLGSSLDQFRRVEMTGTEQDHDGKMGAGELEKRRMRNENFHCVVRSGWRSVVSSESDLFEVWAHMGPR